MLSKENWRKIKDIFEQAEALQPHERLAFAEKACDGDLQLFQELRMMLDADESAMGFIDEGVVEKADAESETSGDWILANEENRIIGPYQVERLLGSGGMGNVYLAHRRDASYDRKVAIKILNHATQTTQDRFRDERQILASLDHPNIAKLFDGGELSGGQPYLVMEFIDGLPIHRFCHENNYTLPQRLTLFRKVCAAVEYAHHNLVVHRDIKPGNILVTRDGEPKLLDFGIAKILSHDTDRTLTGLQIMTPRYASPEQISGMPITTAVDTYALGLLLYELLTGRRPFQFYGLSVEGVCQIILNSTPVPPSVSLSKPIQPEEDQTLINPMEDPARLTRQLSGDLDTIVLKALRKEPGERYSSPAKLSEDIGRYLEGFPIFAKKSTLAERGVKFIKRRPIPVAVGIFFSLLASGLMLSLFFQQKETAAQRDRAEQALEVAEAEKERAENVAAMMLDIFRSVDPNDPNGSNISARELLDLATSKITKSLDQDPELRARFMHSIGSAYLHLGHKDQANAMLDGALALEENLFGESHPSIVKTQLLRVKSSLIAGKLKEAEKRLDRAKDIVLNHYGEDHWEMSSIYYMQSRLQISWRRYHEATDFLEKCVAIMEREPEKAPDLYATALIDLGSNYSAFDSLEKGLVYFKKALAIQEKAFGDEHHSLARTLRKIAFTFSKQEQNEKAEAYYRRALSIMENTFGKAHINVGPPLFDLGYHLGSMGRVDEGYAYLQREYEMMAEVYGPKSPYTAFTYFSRARYLRFHKRFEQSEDLYLQGIAIFEEIPPNQNHIFLITSLAGLYKETEQFEKLEAVCQKGLAFGTREFGGDHPQVTALADVYSAYLESNKPDEAKSFKLSRQNR